MTGVQALERLAPDLPPQPGLVARREFEYKRHGTCSFFINFDVATGQVFRPSSGPTRTEADFLEHVRRTVASDPSHPIVFHYTPRHASWLNQVEMWLSILVRKLLRRGNFRSVDDLRDQVLSFIDYFNRTMAKPFKWTYQGRPLHA